MTGTEQIVVYVYPDGENYYSPPSWKSDDYEIRKTEDCNSCGDQLNIHYNEPFASCACGCQEWYR